MNKSAKFTAAHATAKASRNNYPTYRAAFVAALKSTKNMKKYFDSIAEFKAYHQNQLDEAINIATKYNQVELVSSLRSENLPNPNYFEVFVEGATKYLTAPGFTTDVLIKRANSNIIFNNAMTRLDKEGKLYQ